MRRGLACLALAFGLAGAARAEITPRAGEGDPHIQSVAYDPAQVVGLHVAPGFAVTLIFSPDERVETVTLGDSAAWQVAVNRAADHLVVKPQGMAAPSNLTVITDQRTYSFSLYGATPGEGVQPYTVTFTYPAPPVAVATVAAPAAAQYRLRGARALWPQRIAEDGGFTTLVWPADVALPAVYRVDEGGEMALVNGVMKGGAYVIEGVHARLVFVDGDARASATRIREDGHGR